MDFAALASAPNFFSGGVDLDLAELASGALLFQSKDDSRSFGAKSSFTDTHGVRWGLEAEVKGYGMAADDRILHLYLRPDPNQKLKSSFKQTVCARFTVRHEVSQFNTQKYTLESGLLILS